MKHRVSVTTATFDITRARSAVTVEVFGADGEAENLYRRGEIEIGKGQA